MKKTGIQILSFITILIVGIFIGIIYCRTEYKAPIPVEVRENSKDYKYINPLLFYRISKLFYEDEFSVLDSDLQNYIKKSTKENKAESISVYYRDMNSGHWTGVNEDFKYHPSSMLKVLGMMSYYRQSQDVEGLLSKKLFYKYDKDYGQNYPPEKILSVGNYTFDELIKQMIIYSDNTVLSIFDKQDSENIFNKAYKTFQLPLANNLDDVDGFMSPRSYSSLLRALYNSTYLSREMSEKALDLLTKTTFNKGIISGIPKDIVVAHKFGEHTYELEDNKVQDRELHDCGIVYYPQRPYLICIMTKGHDFKELESVISELSAIVYNYVNSLRK